MENATVPPSLACMKLIEAAAYYAEHDHRPENRGMAKQLLGLRDSIRPIIFDNLVWDEAERISLDPNGVDLDLPFPVCAFERSEGALFGYKDPDKNREWGVLCLVLQEVAPKRYNSWYTAYDVAGGPIFLDYTANAQNSHFAAAIREKLLPALSRSAVGTEAVNERVKIKVGGEKILHKIKQIIRVVPKSGVNTARSLFGRTIDWSHRFEVRGHWRAHGGVGKDREGKYCIEGHTWVSHHVRGPDHLPLIKKTRVVDGESGMPLAP